MRKEMIGICAWMTAAGGVAVAQVVTDKETLAGLTVDTVVSCDYTLGAYCAGGDGDNGVVPDPSNIIAPCGLSFAGIPGLSNADAFNSLDHQYAHGSSEPLIADMGSAVNTVYVFPAVDHLPFPEEGVEATIWGSNSCDLSNFPTGWTLATLTKIYAKGWEDPVLCQGQDNADDFVGQYSFFGSGFQFIAVYANFSISIFDDPSHATWTPDGDDDVADGWQTFDEEIDAVGTPVCVPGGVVADAGADQVALVGDQGCFDASDSTGDSLTFSWDLNGDGVIDATGSTACLTCTAGASGTVTLFVTDSCGCVASDTADFLCNQPPDCSDAAPSQAALWPPNHQFVDVAIGGVTDADGDSVSITIDSIFQDEPVVQAGDGSGRTAPDGTGVGTSTASVRAERNGNPKTPGNGRVYHIGFTATDSNGASCSGTVSVCVPHDQRPSATCVDGGALYDSTVTP